MDSSIDERFKREARRSRLLFACPDCAYFDVEATTCSNGYPTEPHMSAELEGRSVLVFCKAFELK